MVFLFFVIMGQSSPKNPEDLDEKGAIFGSKLSF